MKCKFISSLYQFEFERNASFGFANIFRITSDQNVLKDEFITPKFFENLGSIVISDFIKDPFIYNIRDIEDNPRSSILDQWLSLIQPFLFCMWLIKDNSVNHKTGILSFENGNKNYIVNNTILFSNSKGIYESETFSSEELSEATCFYDRVSEIITCDEECNTEEYKVGDTSIFKRKELRTTPNERIKRAYQFLILARSRSDLIQKISFYTAFLECLFTTDHNEIKRKVRERAARLLGEDKENRLKYFKIIGEAYDIRSTFFHGLGIGKKKKKFFTQEQLIKISTEMDNIVRTLFIKALDEHYKLFTGPVDDLNTWFKELILS